MWGVGEHKPLPNTTDSQAHILSEHTHIYREDKLKNISKLYWRRGEKIIKKIFPLKKNEIFKHSFVVYTTTTTTTTMTTTRYICRLKFKVITTMRACALALELVIWLAGL